MSAPHYPGFDTLSLHAGSVPDPATGARATPIYLTSAFVFKDSDHAASLFNMERAGHVYSRISNPTNAVLEERIAALEGGVAGIAVASGQAAMHLGLATIAGAGSHIVASRALYGGSHNLLSYTMKRFGIETTFVDPNDLDAWRAAIRPNTKVLFGETLGNPGLDVLDIPRISALAHEHYLPLMVDATFTTPYLLKPFEHGADLVFHSATKFLCGHGTAVGGLLVDGGTFDWQQAYDKTGRFGELCEPYEGFHGMVFSEESTVAPFSLRARREGLRDFGAVMSPHNAFAILQGIETLALRMEKHVSNTRKVVEFLAAHAAVESVAYPELPSHPGHALSKTLLPKGCGAVFSFNLKGDRAAGQRMVESLKIFSHLANVGDAKSLVIHPASTTHFRVPSEQLAASGITEGTLRLSVGLENVEDLIEDLAYGLKMSQRTERKGK
ncbi:O-acetylhomoserine aminocarboxypropyltransferase/cysteine synthase family protein [Collimonas fungivorans]|uniref:O-acetylhomoserine aminocarboxypropyltransferase/cysteine synthase family protein n=1 Tax=Collimonas fungivorans TaxID=158899 RepID=A0A127PER5_9BURK|nr:O-acetylhomoserine aminocarboxypropyltransferase [Collimonas fungivorans]AMO96279.1 O-acetylhomoserine aminocarboxypropyltransferase/cysteine synthase family protein [Collimonas fungivorans]